MVGWCPIDGNGREAAVEHAMPRHDRRPVICAAPGRDEPPKLTTTTSMHGQKKGLQ